MKLQIVYGVWWVHGIMLDASFVPMVYHTHTFSVACNFVSHYDVTSCIMALVYLLHVFQLVREIPISIQCSQCVYVPTSSLDPGTKLFLRNSHPGLPAHIFIFTSFPDSLGYSVSSYQGPSFYWELFYLHRSTSHSVWFWAFWQPAVSFGRSTVTVCRTTVAGQIQLSSVLSFQEWSTPVSATLLLFFLISSQYFSYSSLGVYNIVWNVLFIRTLVKFNVH